MACVLLIVEFLLMRQNISDTGCVACIELIISSLFLNHLVMGLPLDDPALLQNHDTIRVPNRGKAVGNDKGGTAFNQPVRTLLHQLLRRVSMEDGASSRIRTGRSATAAREMERTAAGPGSDWPCHRAAPFDNRPEDICNLVGIFCGFVWVPTVRQTIFIAATVHYTHFLLNVNSKNVIIYKGFLSIGRGTV